MPKHLPHASVNSGLIIVRKDQRAREFFDRVWTHRNDPLPNNINKDCLTLGQCPERVRHDLSYLDQEMVATALAEKPELMDTVVSVVAPRDNSSPIRRHIALNTFNYKDVCFSEFDNKGRKWGPITFLGAKLNDITWCWEIGDWCGQPAGVPLKGKITQGFPGGRCADDSSIPVSNPRFDLISKMVQKTVR